MKARPLAVSYVELFIFRLSSCWVFLYVSIVVEIEVGVVNNVSIEYPTPYDFQPISSSNKIVDDPVDIEVEKNAALITIYKITPSRRIIPINTEINIIITITTPNPSGDCASLAARNSKSVVNLVKK